MKRFLVTAIMAALSVLVIAACSNTTNDPSTPAPVTVQAATPKTELRSFTSDQELRTYLKDLAEKQKRRMSRRASPVLSLSAPAAESTLPNAIAGYADESITNVQHAGVDEGGIVKLHGDHLVVLHRGRLFTVGIGGDDLTPISSVDAFGPDVDPAGGTLVTVTGPTEARPSGGLTIDFVVVSDRAQLSEVAQRVRNGRLRTNIGKLAALDDAVAALNPTERIRGKTIIRVRP